MLELVTAQGSEIVEFDDEAEQVIAAAHEIARRRWADTCGTEHLLIALVREVRHIRSVARDFGFADALLDAADREPHHLPPPTQGRSPRLKEVLAAAKRDAQTRGEAQAGVPDLSWALLGRDDSGAATWLVEYAGIELTTFRHAIHGPRDPTRSTTLPGL